MIPNYDTEYAEKEIKRYTDDQNLQIEEKKQFMNIHDIKQNQLIVKNMKKSLEFNSNEIENKKHFEDAFKQLSQKVNGTRSMTKSPDNNSQVENRLLQYNESILKKVELKKKEIELLELNECTFKPRINSSLDKRTFNEFLESQHSFMTKKNEKISKKEQEIRSSLDLNYQSKPEINPNSVKINLKRQKYSLLLHQEPTYIKLYNHQYHKKPPIIEANEGIPKINKKSEDLNRNCKIEVRLYNDAIRRKESQNEKLFNSSKTLQFSGSLKTENNNEFTNSKFKKEYEKILVNLGLDQSTLNFDQVKCILTVMGFIKYDTKIPEILNSFWKVASGGMNITSKESVLNLLLITMKILPDNLLNDNSKIIEYGNLSKHEIQEQFKSLFVNKISFNNSRIVNKKAKNTAKKMQQSSEQYKFCPEIGLLSKTLAKKYKDKFVNTKEKSNELIKSKSFQTKSVEDLLILSKKKNQEKINQIKKEIEIKDYSNCTFHPTLIHFNASISCCQSTSHLKNSLFQIYNRKPHNIYINLFESSKKLNQNQNNNNNKNRKDKTTDDILIERNPSEYTFQPNISKYNLVKLIQPQKSKKEINNPKNEDVSNVCSSQKKDTEIKGGRNAISINIQTNQNFHKKIKLPSSQKKQMKIGRASCRERV